MTPERLEEIRAMNLTPTAPAAAMRDLLDYIDVLHADLHLTRRERDETKKACLVYRKENAALRRGQGSAPEPASPEHPPFHHTHPIPDSTKGQQ